MHTQQRTPSLALMRCVSCPTRRIPSCATDSGRPQLDGHTSRRESRKVSLPVTTRMACSVVVVKGDSPGPKSVLKKVESQPQHCYAERPGMFGAPWRLLPLRCAARWACDS